jgi:hypothetical protein
MSSTSQGLSTLAAAYMILVGIAMTGTWAMFLLTGQVPELQSEPWSIAMHLAAEFITALLLVIAGITLLPRGRWARPIAYILHWGCWSTQSSTRPATICNGASPRSWRCSPCLG